MKFPYHMKEDLMSKGKKIRLSDAFIAIYCIFKYGS